jgi:hypothetical protein
MQPRPKQHVKCQVECSKGANHIIRNKGRVCNFEPCDLDTARMKIANAFPGESALPQPGVHPTFGRVYHSGETVLLVPPVCIPTSDTDTVNVCSAAWSREWIAASWLKQQTPGVRRARSARKQAEATTLLPPPQPQVRLFLVSTCVCACVLWMFRVSISLLRCIHVRSSEVLFVSLSSIAPQRGDLTVYPRYNLVSYSLEQLCTRGYEVERLRNNTGAR